jgi:DNA-binding transcriptional LysR family regulator
MCFAGAERIQMEMQQIRYFLALARTLNFTRAAEECHVSQSALTRAIQGLEAELGGDLVRREHSKSHLTELGKRMLPLMERCFDSAITAKELARSMAGDQVMPLAVAISHSVNVELLMEPIAELFRALPGLSLKLLHGGGDEVLALLKAGDVDIAIAGPFEESWNRLDRWPLFDEPFELAVRDDHPLAGLNELTLEKLAPYPLFSQTGCESRPTALRLFEARGFRPTNLHEVTTQQDVTSLLGKGLGCAIVPRSAPHLDGTRRASISDLSLTRTVSVYAAAGRRRETAASTLLNLLRSADLEPA